MSAATLHTPPVLCGCRERFIAPPFELCSDCLFDLCPPIEPEPEVPVVVRLPTPRSPWDSPEVPEDIHQRINGFEERLLNLGLPTVAVVDLIEGIRDSVDSGTPNRHLISAVLAATETMRSPL